jgi:phage gp45-like
MNQFRHIANRIASMLGVGRITAMNDSGTTQSVQYQTPLEVASAHRLAEFGFSSGLPAGTMLCWRSWAVIVRARWLSRRTIRGFAMPTFSLGNGCL